MDDAVWLMMCSPVAISPSATPSALWDDRSADHPPFASAKQYVNHACREDIFRQLSNFNAVSGVISDGLSTTQFPPPAPEQVSTRPSSADNSTVRRSHDPQRIATDHRSMTFKISPAARPFRQRAAPAKKRKTSQSPGFHH